MDKKANILVVDDEKDLCNIFYKLLTSAGYNVDTAMSGEESIKKAEKKPYQVIFMDVKLPGINGLEAFLKIKKLRPESTTVMMTGYGYAVENLVEQALKNGAYSCIAKPFNITDILDVIKKILNKTKKLEKERKS